MIRNVEISLWLTEASEPGRILRLACNCPVGLHWYWRLSSFPVCFYSCCLLPAPQLAGILCPMGSLNPSFPRELKFYRFHQMGCQNLCLTFASGHQKCEKVFCLFCSLHYIVAIWFFLENKDNSSQPKTLHSACIFISPERWGGLALGFISIRCWKHSDFFLSSTQNVQNV